MSAVKPFEQIAPKDIAKRLADNDFHILRLERLFPLEEYFQKTIQALNEFKPQNKDHHTDYKGLGLQYDDENNPYYDVVNSISYISTQNPEPQFVRKLGGKYVTKNSIGERFRSFFDYFGEVLHLVRGRILIAEPGHVLNEHMDGFCCGTLHYAVQTHPEAKIVIENTEYHIPADGHFYLVNAGRPHFIKNDSDVERIHIVFMVNPACFKVLTKSNLEKMQKYFDQFKLDIKDYKHVKIVDG